MVEISIAAVMLVAGFLAVLIVNGIHLRRKLIRAKKRQMELFSRLGSTLAQRDQLRMRLDRADEKILAYRRELEKWTAPRFIPPLVGPGIVEKVPFEGKPFVFRVPTSAPEEGQEDRVMLSFIRKAKPAGYCGQIRSTTLNDVSFGMPFEATIKMQNGEPVQGIFVKVRRASNYNYGRSNDPFVVISLTQYRGTGAQAATLLEFTQCVSIENFRYLNGVDLVERA